MNVRLLLCCLLFAGTASAQMKVTYPDKMGPFPESQEFPVAALPPTYANELRPVKSLAEVGIANPLTLYKADALIEKAMSAGTFPGCRVFAAKDGKIFYDKSFGYQTYDHSAPVVPNTIYDLASLT